jgi:hypothetical protein
VIDVPGESAMSEHQPYMPPLQPPSDAWQVTPPESTWPKAVGIIMIVLGAYGLFVMAAGIAGALMVPHLKDFLGGTGANLGPAANQFDAMEAHQGMLLVISVTHGLLAGLLLAAGIGILKRRRWSLPLAFVYAVARIIHATVATIAQMPMQKEMLRSTSATPSPLPPRLMELLVNITIPITIAIGCALPVFLLIWLLRPRIKAETAAWA